MSGQKELFVVHSTFSIERTFDAKPERVWHAFSDEKTKRRWFAEGEGWEIFDYKLDFRDGGAETSRFAFQGGPEITLDTHYQFIIPQKRIVFAYKMTLAGAPLSASLSTIDLAPTDAGALMTYTEQGAYFDSAEAPRMREEGSKQLHERLAKELAGEL